LKLITLWLLTGNKTGAFSVRLGACVQRQSDDKCLLSRCSFASLQCFDDFLGGRFLSRKRLKFTNMCHCPSASLWCSIHCMISNYLRSIVSLEVFFTRKTLMKPPSSCLTLIQITWQGKIVCAVAVVISHTLTHVPPSNRLTVSPTAGNMPGLPTSHLATVLPGHGPCPLSGVKRTSH
jgi:hypothetical protein